MFDWEDIWFNSAEEKYAYIRKHNLIEHEHFITLEHNKSACDNKDQDYNLVKHEAGIAINMCKIKENQYKLQKNSQEKEKLFKIYNQWAEALQK